MMKSVEREAFPSDEVDMHPGDNISKVCQNISQKLANVTTKKSKSFIFKLPDNLRNVNRKAYEPDIIAIGPYHRNKDSVKMMEEHKLRYLQSFLERRKEINIAVYVSAIEKMEGEARKCYAETIHLDVVEFTEMLVLDGCFIIELVRKYEDHKVRSEKTYDDPIFQGGWVRMSLMRDLVLFENQIPFSILCKLFDLNRPPNDPGRLMHLVFGFFKDIFPGKGYSLNNVKSSKDIKHLLEFIHKSWSPLDIDEGTTDGKATWRFINSAELRKANVKFEQSYENSLFNIKFENGYLRLPPLAIGDGTESFFRNLIAYEQYFGDQYNYVSSYVKFLGSLINSPADVEILCSHGIIDNWMSDSEMVSVMFNNLDQYVAFDSREKFIYSKIFQSMNAHCERRRNLWMAKLKQHHLDSPWAIISIAAAIVLLLLTATQTLFSVLQVV